MSIYNRYKTGLGIVTMLPACIMSLFGCIQHPQLKYSVNTPAAILHPLGQAPVIDGRARFREILCAVEADHGRTFPDWRPCDQILNRLIDEPSETTTEPHRTANLGPLKTSTTVVFVPGIFGECVENVVTPFSDAYLHLQALGYSVHYIHLSGRSSSAYNSRLLKEGLSSIESDRMIIIAYSKGVPDTLHMLVDYPEVAEKVSALVSISGVVSGTPLADDFSNIYAGLLAKLPVAACPAGDGGGIRSLTREARMSWLSANKIPPSIYLYSFVSFTQRAHISTPLRPFNRLLEKVDARRNDGQMIYYDAVLPGSVLLGYLNGDHWAVALPFNRSDSPLRGLVNYNNFPREIVIESVLRFVDENSRP
jgi:hypothetical protein